MTAPNVVIIYADDLGWGDLGCYGSVEVQTPHLDALATRGVRMTQWYSNSPVCSPSRAALLTGRHPAHAGIDSILGAQRHVSGLTPQETIATLLSRVGYRTAVFGKWHLGVDEASAPTRHGFEQHRGFRAGCVDYYSHIMYWGVKYPLHDLWDSNTEIWRNGEYLTDLITSWATDFIATTPTPFLCYVPYNAPHYPMHAPQQYLEKFAHLPWDKQVMAAMIACLDDGVGRIVAALDSAGVLNDTVILFSSDNGPSAEERNWLAGEEVAYTGGSTGGLRGHKGSLFEGGIRVPTIWSWPAALPQGRDCSAPGQMSDVLPTIASMIDVADQPVDLDGVSMLAPMIGESPPADRTLCWEYESQRAVRHGDWKLVTNPSSKLGAPIQPAKMLFDLTTDPNETTDIASTHPDHLEHLSGITKTFERDLDRWRNG